MIRVLRNLLLLTLLAALALPAVASANPVSDCAGDGDLDRRYTNSQLRRALDNIPGDLDEYSNCREVIKCAISSGSDKRNDTSGDGSGGGGAAVAPAGAEAARRDQRHEQQARADHTAKLEAITGDPDAKPDVTWAASSCNPVPTACLTSPARAALPTRSCSP